MLLKKKPVKHILQSYYATHIMNFITGAAAYCLFPNPTLRKTTYLTRDTAMYEPILKEKYGAKRPGRGFVRGRAEEFKHRGVQYHPPVWRVDGAGRLDARSTGYKDDTIERRVGDRDAWTMRFEHPDGRGGDASILDDGVRGARFMLGVTSDLAGGYVLALCNVDEQEEDPLAQWVRVTQRKAF